MTIFHYPSGSSPTVLTFQRLLKSKTEERTVPRITYIENQLSRIIELEYLHFDRMITYDY